MKCSRCKTTKDLKANSVTTAGNIVYLCRNCNTQRLREYRKTHNGKNNVYKAVKKSIKKFPERQSARKKVYYALKVGHIIKPKICELCLNKKELFGHHEDYKKPLDVMWICRNCHNEQHKVLEF